MPPKVQQHSKLLSTMLTSVIDKINLNKTNHSDYLSVFIYVPPTQMNLVEEEGEAEGTEEEVLSPGVKMAVAVGEAV
jgi:phenylacetate-coenzyme A ligase PaaK-like adenylate-forming protein